MGGNPEDEAINLAMHLGDACVTGIGRLLDLMLRAVDSYKEARYRNIAQGKDGGLTDALGKAVDQRIDGRGDVGFVKNSSLPDDNLFIDAEDIFDADEAGNLSAKGKAQMSALRRACIDNGIGISVSRGIPGEGMVRIGVSAKNVNLLHDGLLKAGLALEKEGIVEKGSFNHTADGKQTGIARKDDGSYKDAFEYAGYSFARDPERESTWVASDPADQRRRLSVTDLGGDKAEWHFTRNGVELASGKVTSIENVEDDPRIKWFKKGEPVFERDEDGNLAIDADGNKVPVYLRDERGEVRRDGSGNPIQAHEKVCCPPSDPECCGSDVCAGIGDFSIAAKGQALESAINDAAVKGEQLSVPVQERTAIEREVTELNQGFEALGKGVGGDSVAAAKGRKAASPSIEAKPSPVEQANRAREAAQKSVTLQGGDLKRARGASPRSHR
ncbi:hypothetical protein NE582_14275 [Gordonibacter pamelaeae]|uniref:hypothetical protein n=1 Tax=Gordonibacter pamelaeae TaxID=471189 RepID=UPI00210E2BC8|nr:hypothetical protein [Gordonibacter pamelaeae]MCQ4848384.1 hypothetical protein [Gordonibacter pamelaeae]MCQ4850797.1 hypothetical protein [Gordonibacter pamelaeae]